MTEISIPWGGTTVGDAGPYSDDNWSDIWRDLFSTDRADEGYLVEIGGELVPSGVVTPIAIQDGAAIVDGKYYQSDAVINVVIPTPVVDTRIDRVVLRKSWATQEVRITRIVGVEGGGAPALVQIDGTTWDIPICQVSITIAGNITPTDQRVPTSSPAGKLIGEALPVLSVTLDCNDQDIDDVGSINFNDGGTADVFLDDDTMAADDPDALVSQQSLVAYIGDRLRLVTGTYTGDGVGAGQAIAGIGIQPILLQIQNKAADAASGYVFTSWPEVMDDDPDGMCMRIITSALIQDKYMQSLDADGFTVGETSHPNQNGIDYNYWLLGVD